MKPKLIVILGPTGCGKTALALQLAQEFGGEIINADSRAIYRGFDIGTAKSTHEEQAKVPHHLLDICDGDQNFSVGEFKKRADVVIVDINRHGCVPFLVGGTMQYISAVVDNWNIPAVSSGSALRAELAKLTKKELQQELRRLDPESYKVIDTENPRRLVRALEVYKTTGQSFVAQRTKSERQYEMLMLGIERPRKELYERIDKRVDQMVEDGLVKEVEQLSKQYGWDAPGMSGIGYREFKNYFEEGAALEEVVQQIKYNNHQYVRKQEAWFKKIDGVMWMRDISHASDYVRAFLSPSA